MTVKMYESLERKLKKRLWTKQICRVCGPDRSDEFHHIYGVTKSDPKGPKNEEEVGLSRGSCVTPQFVI